MKGRKMRKNKVNKTYRKNKKESLKLISNKEKISKKLLILPIIAVFTFIVVFASAITITNIFPTTTPYITNESTVNLSYGIYAPDGVSSITHSWNGTNTTLYDSSLVLFMNFDNRSALGENDTIVKDLSMYGNNGTVVGGENITWGAGYGKYNGAFNFSGKKANVDLGKNPKLNFTDNLTISAWIKRMGNTNSRYIIFGKDYDASNYGYLFAINNYSGQRLEFRINGQDSQRIMYSKIFNIGEWYHVAVSYNGSYAWLYINGNNTYSGSLSSINQSSAINAYIGSHYLGSSNNFNGSIDDVMIWNKTLTALEIGYLYNTSIIKYNSTYLEYNSSNNDNDETSQSAFICLVNSTGSNFCSTTSTFRELETIKSNFSTLKYNLKGNIFGSQIYSSSFYSGGNLLSNSCGTLNGNNYTLVRDNYLNANLNILRYDLSLNKIIKSDLTLENLTEASEIINWSYQNNISVILLIKYTPDWLANITTGWCNWTTSNSSCPSTNYSLYGDAIVKVLDFLTNNGIYENLTYLELWNEPWGTTWLNNLSTDNLIKGTEYVKLYNGTYTAVKSKYPNIKVGAGLGFGYSITTHTVNYPNLVNTFFSNLTSSYDVIYPHQYISPLDTSPESSWVNNTLESVINTVLDVCTDNSADCSNIIFTEYNLANIYPSSNVHSATIAKDFSYFLNNHGNNVSLLLWSFTSTASSNLSCDGYYKFALTQSYNNTLTRSYNVTKNFAHLCPAGATVYVTSNDDSSLKQVSCKKGNQYSLIVINTDTNAKNVTINMSLTNGSVFFPYSKLTNYEDSSDIYTISSGITQLGIMDSYDILYLTNDSQVPTITIESPTNTTYLTSSNWFNVSLDEDGSMCYYSLNNGANTSLTQSGVLTDFYKYITGLTQIHNTVIFYCNDTYNNWGTASVTFTASTPPTYTDNSVSNTIFGHNVKFEITVTDDIALESNGQWIFSSDNTGEWKNDTAVNFSSTPETVNVKKDIIKFSGDTLSYRWYFTDNAGNTNSTEVYSFTVSCENETNTIYNLIMIVASLMVLSIFGFFGWKKIQDGEPVTVGEIITVVIVVSVCIALWLASGQTMGTTCGAIG